MTLERVYVVHACHAQIARRANLPQGAAVVADPKSVASFMHPALTRGALRGRHGRWERDAVDATASQRASMIRKRSCSIERARTNDADADGEVVWSWRSNAGAKVAELSANDGGNQAGHRGEHEGHR